MYERSSCPFVKMIPQWENHFGKIAAMSLIYFWTMLIMIFSPVYFFSGHTLEFLFLPHCLFFFKYWKKSAWVWIIPSINSNSFGVDIVVCRDHVRIFMLNNCVCLLLFFVVANLMPHWRLHFFARSAVVYSNFQVKEMSW